MPQFLSWLQIEASWQLQATAVQAASEESFVLFGSECQSGRLRFPGTLHSSDVSDKSAASIFRILVSSQRGLRISYVIFNCFTTCAWRLHVSNYLPRDVVCKPENLNLTKGC